MKSFLFLVAGVAVFATVQCKPSNLEDLNEEEFEETFNLPPVNDPVEYKRRDKALKENEAEIKKVNQKYKSGDSTWFDEVNKYSDLPEDEFIKARTGAAGIETGRGLIAPPEAEQVDEVSERYFDKYRYSRAAVPSSYSSVDEGLVSPIKSQGQCGSCVAFATTNVVETCYRKITGVFGDYSEQQMVDCGYGKGGFGCNGAYPHAYAKWAGDRAKGLASEKQYPYKNTQPSLVCRNSIPVFNQGAVVSGSYYTYGGDEELMKRLVYEHGAVVATVKAAGPFSSYRGGVFSGCYPGTATDHAISVVGYGTEGGVPYWLIKNSWGTWWGDNGYIKIERGVGMCGIGPAIAVVECTESYA